MAISAPKGTFDIIPGTDSKPLDKEGWRFSELWQHLEGTIRDVTRDYGFSEIRTPMFERTELFQRGVGEGSDIVTKEMYTFQDKGERWMTLRPEGTASVMRACMEEGLISEGSTTKLYYISPMFRYERPQAGRYRQHHQFGAEAIGAAAADQDVEVIDMLCTFYRRVGLKNLTVNLNSLGSAESRKKYRTALKKYLEPHLSDLSEDSQQRFENNPLRILDSKDKGDRKILQGAPDVLAHLDEESETHFEEVKALLTSIDIPFTIDTGLVRGLDYYTKTVFEVTAGELGAQDSVGGGGRYDGLIKTLGGPDLPAFGFGCGMERVLHTLIKQEGVLPKRPRPTLFVIPLGEKARRICFHQVHAMRKHGISCQLDFSGRKLKKILSAANRLRSEYVVVVGDEEVENDRVAVKEMETGHEQQASLSGLTLEMIKLMGAEREHTLNQLTGQLSELLDKGLGQFEEAEEFMELFEHPSQLKDDDE
jgi:histidyl-tRNA synthetase